MRAKLLWWALLAVLLGYAIVANSIYMERYKDYVELRERIIYVPQIDAIRGLAQNKEGRPMLDPRTVVRGALLGNEALLADVLWVRAIHYLGGNYSTLLRFPEKRDDFVNLIQTLHFLDPDFLAVYRFAAFVYQEFLEDYDAACDELIEGAARAGHDLETRWRYYWEAAFIQFSLKKDYDMAREYCEMAASVPGVEPFVPRLCGIIDAERGQRAVALEFFRDREEQAHKRGDALGARITHNHINRVLNQVDMDWYRRAWELYMEARGLPPDSVAELLRFGELREVTHEVAWHRTGPEDARGGYYVIADAGPEAVDRYGLQPGPQVVSTYDHIKIMMFFVQQYHQICVLFGDEKGRPPQTYEDLIAAYPEYVPPDPPRDWLGLGRFTLEGGLPDYEYTTPQLDPEQQELATQFELGP